MKKERISIGRVPALLWGEPAEKLYLSVHGQGGNKEEAIVLANRVCPMGYQVLSIDLPGHGERTSEADIFDPWHCVPEIAEVMQFARQGWKKISLHAVSIGAWFSMQALPGEKLANCAFVSPIVDMEGLIRKMMLWANVSEAMLEECKVIPTDFGQTLSWEYFTWVLKHPIERWEAPTNILYGEKDYLMDQDQIEKFTQKYSATLTIMKDGEHWFHTPEQMAFMEQWMELYVN